MDKKTIYYKLKVEMEQELKRRLTEDEVSIVKWMAEKSKNEKCKK